MYSCKDKAEFSESITQPSEYFFLGFFDEH